MQRPTSTQWIKTGIVSAVVTGAIVLANPTAADAQFSSGFGAPSASSGFSLSPPGFGMGYSGYAYSSPGLGFGYPGYSIGGNQGYPAPYSQFTPSYSYSYYGGNSPYRSNYHSPYNSNSYGTYSRGYGSRGYGRRYRYGRRRW